MEWWNFRTQYSDTPVLHHSMIIYVLNGLNEFNSVTLWLKKIILF
jgi:hypothetical protein